MFSAIFAALVLTAILALTVLHMPVLMKRALNVIPGWLQSVVLHFGYAGWIGGVTGHMMGAPLAIFWYAAWVWYIKPRIEQELGPGVTTKQVIQALAARVRGFFSFGRKVSTELQAEVAVQA